MDHLMEQCIYEMEFAKYGCDVANSSLIAILLTKMLRCWLSLGLPLNDIMWETISDHPAFEEIATYIDEHYNESLRVKDLANLFGMSYSYFSKLFRQTYNQSCKEYIEFTRLNHVLDLLRFTHLDLTYISQETGFSDCSHLIRTFKKWTGTTPMHWRKENGYR